MNEFSQGSRSSVTEASVDCYFGNSNSVGQILIMWSTSVYFFGYTAIPHFSKALSSSGFLSTSL